MNPARRTFLDTCTLINFATVGQLRLLEDWCARAGATTEAIELELSRMAIEQPAAKDAVGLPWLGEPIVIGEDRLATKKIDISRRALGGSPTRPLQHLAEAQIIYHIQHMDPSAIFVTDDAPGADFAARRGIAVMNTADVVADCFVRDLVGCPEAYEILQRMRDLGRGVAVPPSHWYVCPPT